MKKMNNLYSALLSLVMVFGLAGNAKAYTLDLGTLASPGSYTNAFANDTNGSVSQMSFAAGSVEDIFDFQIDVPSSLGATTTSIGATASSSVFSSFSLTLLQQDGDGWDVVASHGGMLFGSTWLTQLNFSPINPAYYYQLVVNAEKYEGHGGYGGNISVAAAPIPEPGTYAMLAAGLGLMGFVARRRRQNDAAA